MGEGFTWETQDRKRDIAAARAAWEKAKARMDELVRAGTWDKTPPAPDLPDEIVNSTSARYREAYRRLTGEELPDFK